MRGPPTESCGGVMPSAKDPRSSYVNPRVQSIVRRVGDYSIVKECESAYSSSSRRIQLAIWLQLLKIRSFTTLHDLQAVRMFVMSNCGTR